MKKIFKFLLFVLGFLIVTLTILYVIYNKPLPEGEKTNKADVLAHKMLTAINNDAYKNAKFFEWSFAGGSHTYKWDKQNGEVDVTWSDKLVKLNLGNSNKSQVFENGAEVIGDSKFDLITTATDYFNNDSFWLVAPFKIFDNGTTRSIVNFEDGTEGLMVTYESGGTTPGDSYVWKLNEKDLPISYQMWVKIIPVGGLEATWDNWKQMENGIYLPTSHKLGPITLDMGNVRSYNQ
ncbi:MULTISPECIES: hypothetical protein [Cellulophaga]|uniref:hypothetical protein n=1 Tax=Cellulophaga TaxID=104264 RepID=UPI002090B82D|nr:MULTISPECIES: hypothetical protein [Cellulophaga]MDO6767782.1 hypothetical protein [Cellulophaga sp. 1_MG-2023]